MADETMSAEQRVIALRFECSNHYEAPPVWEKVTKALEAHAAAAVAAELAVAQNKSSAAYYDCMRERDEATARAERAEATLTSIVDSLTKQRPREINRDTRLGAAILDAFLPPKNKKMSLRELGDAYQEMLGAIDAAEARAEALAKERVELIALLSRANVDLHGLGVGRFNDTRRLIMAALAPAQEPRT